MLFILSNVNYYDIGYIPVVINCNYYDIMFNCNYYDIMHVLVCMCIIMAVIRSMRRGRG